MHRNAARFPDAIDADLLPPTRRELIAYWFAWTALGLFFGILLVLALAL